MASKPIPNNGHDPEEAADMIFVEVTSLESHRLLNLGGGDTVGHFHYRRGVQRAHVKVHMLVYCYPYFISTNYIIPLSTSTSDCLLPYFLVRL